VPSSLVVQQLLKMARNLLVSLLAIMMIVGVNAWTWKSGPPSPKTRSHTRSHSSKSHHPSHAYHIVTVTTTVTITAPCPTIVVPTSSSTFPTHAHHLLISSSSQSSRSPVILLTILLTKSGPDSPIRCHRLSFRLSNPPPTNPGLRLGVLDRERPNDILSRSPCSRKRMSSRHHNRIPGLQRRLRIGRRSRWRSNSLCPTQRCIGLHTSSFFGYALGEH